MYLSPHNFLNGTSYMESESGKMHAIFYLYNIPGKLNCIFTADFISPCLGGMFQFPLIFKFLLVFGSFLVRIYE